jgi:hypothetical protein
MIEKHDTAKRELNLSELDAAVGGGKFHYVEMNGETWAVNGNGKPVQVTHNAPFGLGWLYGT